jgi:hypothetical protein
MAANASWCRLATCALTARLEYGRGTAILHCHLLQFTGIPRMNQNSVWPNDSPSLV